MTLAEFIAARLDEDQAAVKTWDEPGAPLFWPSLKGRVLRQVTAIRAILADYEMWCTHAGSDPPGVQTMSKAAAGTLARQLRYLAAIWSDHEQYDARWKP